MLENSVQVMPESKRQVSGEEKKLAVALQSKLIQDASFDELKESLRLVMVKLGLRAQNWPNDLEKVVLFDHIRENFGGNRVEEIRLAFEMAIAYKLDLEDVKCYENFSCAYFSLIMTSYQRWSSEAFNHVKLVEPPPQKIFSEEEIENSARQDVELQYQRFLKGFEVKGLGINKIILEKDKLLQDGEDVFDFFKRKAMSGIFNIYKRQ